MSANEKSDPYRQFHFRLTWRGKVVAGFSDVSGLGTGTKPVANRAGDESNSTSKLPGMAKFEAIMLKRGITYDTEFFQWAGRAHAEGQPRDDVSLDLLDERGIKTLHFKVHRAWVSKYVASPLLDADAKEVAIEEMALEHEGWKKEEGAK